MENIPDKLSRKSIIAIVIVITFLLNSIAMALQPSLESPGSTQSSGGDTYEKADLEVPPINDDFTNQKVVAGNDSITKSISDNLISSISSPSTIPSNGNFNFSPISVFVHPDRIIYVYQSTPGNETVPSVGDYVSGFDNSGSVRLVRSVDINSNTVTLHTSNVESVSQLSGESNSYYGVDLTVNIPLLTIDQKIHSNKTVGGADVVADGRFYLATGACFKANMGWFGLDSAAAVLYMDFYADMKVTITSSLEWETIIASYESPPAVFWIGTIPVTVSLYWNITATFNAEGHITIGASVSAHKVMGIVYANGQWYRYEEGSGPTITPTTPEAGVDAEAKLSMPFGIRMRVFDIAGPYIGLEPYVRAFLSASLQGIDYGVFIGVDVVAGFRFQIGPLVIVDEKMTLTNWEKKVWPDSTKKGPSPPRILTQSIKYVSTTPNVVLSFQHSSDDQTSSLSRYEIYRGSPFGALSLWATTPITSSNPVTWTDNLVTYGTGYRYELVVVDKVGKSSPRTPPVDTIVTVPALSIAVYDPPGVSYSNPAVESGLNYRFSWASPIVGGGDSVKILLVKSGSGQEYQIAGSVTNSGTAGSYSWFVDSGMYPLGGSYRIKVVSLSRPDIFGFSPIYFNIVYIPRTITVIEPHSGLVVQDDGTLNIRWQSTGSISVVTIWLKSASQNYKQSLEINYPNTGSLDYYLNHFINYVNDPKRIVNGSNDFQILIGDSLINPSIVGEGPKFTMIESPAPFEIDSPTSHDVLILDQLVTITWTSFVGDSSVEIRASQGGSNWWIANAPNTGSYTFSLDLAHGFPLGADGRYHIFYVGVSVSSRYWHDMTEPILIFKLGDIFEIDDNYSLAKPILADSPQIHNLKNYRPDQDWIWFKVDDVSNVTIMTYNPPINVDTQMWLFSQSGVPTSPLAYNDDSSSSNKSSTIVLNDVIPGIYYVRVSPGFTGPFSPPDPYSILLKINKSGSSRLKMLSPAANEVVKIAEPYDIQWKSRDYPNGSIQLILQKFVGYCNSSYLDMNPYAQTPTGIAAYGNLLYVISDRAAPGTRAVFVVQQSDLSVVDSKSFAYGSGTDQLGNYPKGIAVDDSFVYLSDEGGNNRIIKLNKADLSWVTSYGTSGQGVGQFISPQGMEIDGDKLYIADGFNGRIVVLNKTDMSWVGSSPLDLSREIFDLAILGNSIYVSYASSGEVAIFDKVTLSPLLTKDLGQGILCGISIDNQGLFVETMKLLIRLNPENLEIIDTYNGAGIYPGGLVFNYLQGLLITQDWVYLSDWGMAYLVKIQRPKMINVTMISVSTPNDLSYSWTPSGSIPEERYYILGQFTSNLTISSISDEFILAILPSTPSNVMCTSSPGQVNISWQANSSDPAPVTYYRIYRNTSIGGWAMIFTGPPGTLFYLDTSVVAGLVYHYRLVAGNSHGDGKHIEVVGFTVPGKVLGLSGVCDNVTGIVSLSWASSFVGDLPSIYKIYRNSSQIAQTNDTWYVDTNLTMGQSYPYQVVAGNSIGQGTFSDTLIILAIRAPSAVENFTLLEGYRNASLSWTPPLDIGGSPILGYIVHVSGIINEETLATEFIVQNFTRGQHYYIFITTRNAAGESSPSATLEYYLDYLTLSVEPTGTSPHEFLFEGTGFLPGHNTSISIDGSGPLASVKADSQGRVSGSFNLSLTVAPGIHNWTLRDIDWPVVETSMLEFLAPPTPSFNVAPSIGNVTTIFNFDASNSSDLQDQSSVLQVRWDWDNDGTWDTAWSTAKTATHQYPTIGLKTIGIEVMNAHGLTNITTRMIDVQNTPPIAMFTATPSIGNSSTIFSVNASYSNDVEDSLGILMIRWDWDNDGTWDTAWSSVKTSTHNYPFGGDYTIRLQVKDSLNLTGEAILIISVDDLAPTTVPTLTGASGDNDWYLSSVSIDLSASDLKSGVAVTKYRIDGGAWQTYIGTLLITFNGAHTVEYYSIDLVCNTETTKSISFKIDKTIPTTLSLLSGAVGSNGWYVSSFTVTLTPSDAVSGLNYTKYRIDGGTWQIYSVPFVISSNGTHVVDYFSIDLAGNNGSGSINIKKDTTIPVTSSTVSGTIGGSNWYNSSVRITLTASDSPSGINCTKYSLDGGAWMTYIAPFDINANGSHILQFYSIDMAGNSESYSAISFKIDIMSPEAEISPSGTIGYGSWYLSNVTIVLTCSDNDSGVKNIMWRIDNGAWFSYSTPIVVGSLGTHLIEFYSQDNANNIELIHTFLFGIDKNPPSLVISLPLTNLTEGDITLSWIGSDATCDIDHFEVSIDGGAFTVYSNSTHDLTMNLSAGNHSISIRAFDVAGNFVQKDSTFSVGKKEIPSSSDSSFNIPAVLLYPILIGFIVICIELFIIMRENKNLKKERGRGKKKP